MGSLEIALDGVPILVLVGCIVWIVRFNISQQKGERLTLKWKDMDPLRKAVAALIFVWICLNLYLTVGNELAFLNVVVLPLGSVYYMESAGSASNLRRCNSASEAVAQT